MIPAQDLGILQVLWIAVREFHVMLIAVFALVHARSLTQPSAFIFYETFVRLCNYTLLLMGFIAALVSMTIHAQRPKQPVELHRWRRLWP